MTVYSKAEILRSSRERERKRKNIKRGLGLSIIIIIVGGFLSILNLNFFRLTTFSILGQTSQDHLALEQAVTDRLAGYYLWLIPNNSVFFFSKDNLAVSLKQQFPGLQSVIIDSPNLNTLTVTVADQHTKILWCHELTSGKRCYYLNDAGLVYQPAPNFSDSIIMEFDSETAIKKLPTLVISPQDLSRVKLFSDFLKSTLTTWPRLPDGSATISPTYKVSHFRVRPLKDFEVIIESLTKPTDSWKILFNTNTPTDQLITNFNSLIKDPVLTRDWSTTKTLDYLDFRFENKVFYKFK